MAGGFGAQFNRQQIQNAYGGQNNSGQYNGNSQNSQLNNGNDNNPRQPGNFSRGQTQDGHYPNGQFNRDYNGGGINQRPSYNFYGKSDGPMDPPKGQQSQASQSQGTPNQPPRLFSPGPPGQNNSRPGSSSGPPQNLQQNQPPRLFSPDPLSPNRSRPSSSSGPPRGQHEELQQRQNPFAQGLGYDPAKPQGQEKPYTWVTNTRLDLPAAAHAAGKGVSRSLDFVVLLLHFVSYFSCS
jgi:hypothetical protein